MPDWWAEGGSRPACRPTFFCKKVGKEPHPCCPRPLRCVSLRYRSTGAANLLGLCGKTHCVLTHSVQTHCRRFDDDAAALCGAAASPKRLPSQARGHKGRYQARDSFFVFLIAAYAIWISARGQFRHESGRPSAPVLTRVSAPAARRSGCVHWHRRVPMLRPPICGNVFERSGVPRSEFCRTAA